MTPSSLTVRSEARGFTLIELMIVVAIIGILVAVAMPIYNQAVVKSRRSDAKAALLDLAQREERYLSTANQYTQTASLLNYGAGSTVTQLSPLNVQSGSASYYQLMVSTTSTPAFAASAVPTGAQATKDTQCGTYTLDNTGKQGVTGTGSPADCW